MHGFITVVDDASYSVVEAALPGGRLKESRRVIDDDVPPTPNNLLELTNYCIVILDTGEIYNDTVLDNGVNNDACIDRNGNRMYEMKIILVKKLLKIL